jgi:hypothetical protein
VNAPKKLLGAGRSLETTWMISRIHRISERDKPKMKVDSTTKSSP